MDQNKLRKILKDMEIPDHLTYLISFLRNLYDDQEATVRTGHETMDSFIQNWERSMSGCILSPYLFNIMSNARLDESQARIKTAGRNINNLRYVDDNSLMAESEEGLKSLLLSERGE